MNIQLLPREIQILISEYNVDHRPKMNMVLDELLERFVEYDYTYRCYNCGSNADPEYTINNLWGVYDFCGLECSIDSEYYIHNIVSNKRYCY